MVVIRLATRRDVPAMARLWQEKMVIQQQTDRRFSLSPDGQALWSDAVAQWLDHDDYTLYVADHADTIVGYIVGCVEAAPPGLLPARVGVVVDLAVGVHSNQPGLGQRLLEPLREWLVQQGISRVIVSVSRRRPVEQAFWRALGASELSEVFWLKL